MAANDVLHIVTAHRPPLMSVISTDGAPVFQGFLADLFKELLAARLNMRYEFYNLTQASGGILRNGTWTGVMGELVSGRANASAFPLTLTADRANAISYTTAYLDEGYAMLVKQHRQTLPAHAFLLPFHANIWFMLLACLVVVSVLLAVLDCVTRRARIRAAVRWKGPERAIRARQENGPQMQHALETIFMGIGQGSSPHTKSWSVKLLFIAWAIFSVIMMTSYTANLTAHLTVAQLTTQINSLRDLSLDRGFFGVPGGSSIESYFRGTSDAVAHSLENRMLTYPSPTEGQAAVRAGNISAFITDWPVVTYMAQQQPCDLTVGSDTFGPGALVLGLPKDSSLAQALNTALLNLIEEGYITNLKRRYFVDASECNNDNNMAESSSLDLGQLYGVFILLCGGIVIALVWALGEVLYYNHLHHKAKQLSKTITTSRIASTLRRSMSIRSTHGGGGGGDVDARQFKDARTHSMAQRNFSNTDSAADKPGPRHVTMGTADSALTGWLDGARPAVYGLSSLSADDQAAYAAAYGGGHVQENDEDDAKAPIGDARV